MELILGLFTFYFQTIVVFNQNVAGETNGQTQTLSTATNHSNYETHLLNTNRSTDGNFTNDVKDMHIVYALERTQDVPVTNSTSLENTKLVHFKVNKAKKIVFNQIKIPSKVVEDGVTTTSKNDMHKATFEPDVIQAEPEGSFNSDQNVDIAMHRSDVGHTEDTEFNVTQTEGLQSKLTAYFNEGENLNNLTYPTEKFQFDNKKEQKILHDSQFDSENIEYQDTFDWRRREDSYNLTEPEQYPYSVLLIIRGADTSTCTGSIITEEWVLTAAHCLVEAEELIVYAGGHSMEELTKFVNGSGPLPPTAQVLRSSSFIIHPRYVGGDFDVGLIKVKGKFNFTRAVSSIQLTTTPWMESYHGYTTCVLTAFGDVQVGEENKDDTYRKTTRLDIKSPCLCSFYLRMQLGSESTTGKFLCSKPKLDYGMCYGDSGGGLVCGGKLRGVASKLARIDDTKNCDMSIIGRMQCGGMTTLSVFQDICPFLPWINEHTNVFNGTKISKKCKYSGSARTNNSYGLLFINIVLIVLIN
ncbi:coagulation factor X-like [Macrosteles quadrilineatus]|uniref:coagulation factor X-like n=1 Tax=Macrosteles quadrilineatus TaxID=74068 RepID=UPI0023E2940B|nr:coagulation factor X-like [Macrosteles quadrilineatus]